MERICRVTKLPFQIDEQDLRFYKKVSPKVGETRLPIPPPTICPEERHRRRFAFRNERYLYRNTCVLTGRSLVSPYSPDKKLKVCDRTKWLELDNREFGRDFDFNRPFFEQFTGLYRDTYKAHVQQAGEMVNSEYTHFVGYLKNCYMVFDMGKSEDCSYGVFMGYSRNCQDCYFISECELCYESCKLQNCYHIFFSSDCATCSDSGFLANCIGCQDCLLCANLRHKRFYVGNQYVGEEAFRRAWRDVFNGRFTSLTSAHAKWKKFLAGVPHKALNNINADGCTGDDLNRCEDVFDSFNCFEAKDLRYCSDVWKKTNDCYDVTGFGEGMQFCCEVTGSGGAIGKSEISNIFYSCGIFYGGYNILYSMSCHESCKELFGCCDLRRQKHCVLNKQYSEAEYNKLVPRIVEHMQRTGEWGEFFPLSISPFGYNESLAMEFYPLQQSDVEEQGGWWSRYAAPVPDCKASIPAEELPDDIDSVSDDVIETAIICEKSHKPFRLIAKELKFYREQGLPLPRLHSEVRSLGRMWNLRPRKLWERPCTSCGTVGLTSLSSGQPEQLVCPSCYETIAE